MNILIHRWVSLSCLVMLTCGESATGRSPSTAGRGKLLDNNLKCVDLSDLRAPLPLVLTRSKRILRRTEAWEHSTWDPKADRDSVGYPAVVKNDRGKRPDGKYYLYYAHHDPSSGIGCAVAEAVGGPYRKLAQLDAKRKHSMVLVNPHYPARRGDPSHYSSPRVLWNADKKLWYMYFHYFNHYHGAWEKAAARPGKGYQMTALATCADLGSHKWTVVRDQAVGKVSVHDILPVLPTTRKTWMSAESSYHAIQRLPDGRWLAFMRGTALGGLPQLGFATSANGRGWQYLPQNPVIHPNDGGGGQKGIYRPYFVGYLGINRSKKRMYLLVWGESPASGDVPKVTYGYTTDFVKVQRDRRGYARWTGGDGPISPWREGNKLYLFAGKYVHTMILSTSSRRAR